MSQRPIPPPKVVTGYCEPWSLRSGESITLFSSSHSPCPAELSLVRIDCGDPTRYGAGFVEEETASALPKRVELADQALQTGSYATVDLSGIRAVESVELSFGLLLTQPDEPQTLAWLETSKGHLAIVAENGVLCADLLGTVTELRVGRLATRRWYQLTLNVDLVSGTVRALVSTEPSASPGRDLLEPDPEEVVFELPTGDRDFVRLAFGGTPDGGFFDGRIAQASLCADDTKLVWDFSEEMAGRRMVDVSGNERHGELHQLPARGVTGPTWDGSEQRWTDAPEQWNAVHFHKDDIYDAGWAPTAELTLPPDLPSGIYAFRLLTEHGDDRVPFFVRPGIDQPTADVAMLMSTATYLAYANHRMLFEGADYMPVKARLRPEHEYVKTHPGVGRSMYEKHLDGSGVMFSSRRRPVLHLRPGADGWNFTPDTNINAFLKHVGIDHDIIGDEDLHADGFEALAPYRVIVTSSHPEYWSAAMLDALTEWQRGGGRLMYLGANGLYWRVAFSDEWPGAMELRRAEDGVRNWQTEDGESYHAFTGEYGGMWRRNGRTPNELLGVGFAAQGFLKAVHYDIDEQSRASRAAWIWDGVEDDDGKIGTSGLGGGAAGQEVDRYDTELGSPEHAVVLASATQFGPDMVRTKEEFEGSVEYTLPDPYVRADIVFYETPGGGAVFSVGSIAWFGALARDGFNNDVATMTANVLKRFADPEPFVPPTG